MKLSTSIGLSFVLALVLPMLSVLPVSSGSGSLLSASLVLLDEEPHTAKPGSSETTIEAAHDAAEKVVSEAGHDDAGHAGAGHEAGAHGPRHLGEPEHLPSVISWKTDMALYSLLVFIGLLALMSKYIWGPIVQGLDAREKSIQDNIAAAEAARVKSEQMLADYQKKLDAAQDEVREIVAEARRDAEHTKNDIIATAQREASLTQKRATEEIERARDQALNELFATMSTQVVTTTERLLGRTIDANDRERLVQDALGQMSGDVFPN